MGEQFQKINKEQGVFSFKKEAAKLEAVWQSLEVATEYLAREMKEFIDSNSVDVIISDEAGGRIPSLIMWEIMRLVHPDNGPELKFLSAGRKRVDMKQLKKLSLTGKQALVVTEYIESGHSMKQIGESFKILKIKKPALCSFRSNKKELNLITFNPVGGLFRYARSGIQVDKKMKKIFIKKIILEKIVGCFRCS
jgi:predicted DNA-binding protein YlxM (UPF0122 family)